MQHKFPADMAQCKSSSHTNHIVKAEQSLRKDAPLSPEAQATVGNEQETLSNECALEDAETAAATAEDDDEQETSPLFVDILGNKVESQLDIWVRILQTVVPEEESDFFDNDEKQVFFGMEIRDIALDITRQFFFERHHVI